jgi:hypothetical protein
MWLITVKRLTLLSYGPHILRSLLLAASKYVSFKSTYLDLTLSPATYNNKPNTYSTEYVAVYYIPTHMINSYKKLNAAARYNLDSAGINLNKTQGLASVNATLTSTQSSPSFDHHSC